MSKITKNASRRDLILLFFLSNRRDLILLGEVKSWRSTVVLGFLLLDQFRHLVTVMLVKLVESLNLSLRFYTGVESELPLPSLAFTHDWYKRIKEMVRSSNHMCFLVCHVHSGLGHFCNLSVKLNFFTVTL